MSKTKRHVPILCQSPNGQELANFRGDTGRLAKETIVGPLAFTRQTQQLSLHLSN